MNQDDQRLNEEGRTLWDEKAVFWDALHGDMGNAFQQRLISPAVERLLALEAGERVLDIGCGNGVMARRLAALGAEVTGVDFSAKLIELAEQRGSPGRPIRYAVVDAIDEDALVALGAGDYDAIVCNMALMDMPVIVPLYRPVRRLLRPAGRFVFATAHPAFNSNNPVFLGEMADQDGTIKVTRSLKIAQYKKVPPVKGAGAPNEPNPHYYYHRPLHQLLGEAFAAGLLLDGLEEPSFDATDADPTRDFSWRNIPQIPPVLAARLRIANDV